MNSKPPLSILCIFLAVPSAVSTTVAQIIPERHRIRWSPGVPDGKYDHTEGSFSVVDFGAVGDGVTDDSDAIAAAIDFIGQSFVG